MRRIHVWIAAGCVGFGLLGHAEAPARKPGLWEMKSTTTWQKAPEVPGDQAEKLRTGSHTTRICLTEEMINDYGALLPVSHGQCTVENRKISGGRVTGEYVCTGMMTGKGKLLSEWTDSEHARGTVHFVGTFQVGSEAQPIEWTTESISTFKSSSCGAVKPKTPPRR